MCSIYGHHAHSTRDIREVDATDVVHVDDEMNRERKITVCVLRRCVTLNLKEKVKENHTSG